MFIVDRNDSGKLHVMPEALEWLKRRAQEIKNMVGDQPIVELIVSREPKVPMITVYFADANNPNKSTFIDFIIININHYKGKTYLLIRDFINHDHLEDQFFVSDAIDALGLIKMLLEINGNVNGQVNLKIQL